MIDELHDSPIRSHVKIPSISRRVTASLRVVFHRHQRRRTWTYRQFLLGGLCHSGAGIPISMERENQPIIVVDESRLDFVFHVGWRAAELIPVVGDLYRLAVLIFSLVRDLPGLGFPSPGMRKIQFESRDDQVEGIADRVDLSQ